MDHPMVPQEARKLATAKREAEAILLFGLLRQAVEQVLERSVQAPTALDVRLPTRRPSRVAFDAD